MIDLKISGRETFLDLQIAARRLDETLRTAVRDLAKRFEADLKNELRRPKSGKTYGGQSSRAAFRRSSRKTVIFGRTANVRTVVRRTVKTRAYRASAPGEAPASFTGTELRSIRVKAKAYGATIFADRGTAFYRHFLEFGTKQRTQRTQRGKAVNRRVGAIAPRPVFSPLQARLDVEMRERVERAVDLFVAFGR